MRNVCALILLFSTALLPVAAQAQDDKPLPRVLIIGDAVYQHARSTAADLKDEVRVDFATFPSGMVLNSTTAIEHLDQLLGRIDRNGNAVPEEKWPAWDLIHFNVGLGDLIHCVPDIQAFRVLPIHAGGVVATTPEAYENNLDEIVRQLKTKAEGAKLVWASTTPIRASSSNVFEMGSEIQYNKIAAVVMKKHRVPTNDMYGFVKDLIDMDKPAGHGADPFNFDKKPIHPPIVEIIREHLGLPVPEREAETGTASS